MGLFEQSVIHGDVIEVLSQISDNSVDATVKTKRKLVGSCWIRQELKVCASPECKNSFIPTNGSQIFCTKQCQGRASYLAHRAERLTQRRKYYRENRQQCLESSRRLNQERRDYIHSILVDRGCAVCGETDWRVLDFHHPNPNEKEIDVSALKGHSLKRINEEAAKCVVLCANHHRLAHYEMEMEDVGQE